ncbi:hypothetical protein J6590_059305 [Homalodisca vitripennis]|nr:hypothetical protein J6590_073960 [Homalodisca vitripennis]KAG8242790.1 hypothetical protein J6590_059305 [Homalodisca vitripennis]
MIVDFVNIVNGNKHEVDQENWATGPRKVFSHPPNSSSESKGGTWTNSVTDVTDESPVPEVNTPSSSQVKCREQNESIASDRVSLLAESVVNVWFQFFREVCAFVIINYTKAIGGPGHIVDICEHQLQSEEESYDVWMLAGVDRNTGQNFAIHVEDLDCETLLPVLKNYLLPGTVVVTERYKEFANNGSLTFVHPNKYPGSDGDYRLDAMWDALSQYIASEVSNNSKICKELFAYQFLYFHRDGFFNRPVSQLISVFFDDVKHVYPGFNKSDNVQFKTRKIKDKVKSDEN